MINLPLPNKLEINYTANYSLNIDSYKVAQGANNTVGVNPNIENETLNLVYPSLLYSNASGINECLVVENALKNTGGVERISYNNVIYILKDKYSVEYNNMYAKLSLSLLRIG